MCNILSGVYNFEETIDIVKKYVITNSMYSKTANLEWKKKSQKPVVILVQARQCKK